MHVALILWSLGDQDGTVMVEDLKLSEIPPPPSLIYYINGTSSIEGGIFPEHPDDKGAEVLLTFSGM